VRDFAVANRADFFSRKGGNFNGFAVEGHEFDIEAFSLAVNQDHSADIPAYQPIFGHIRSQHDDIQFLYHFV